MSIDSTDQSYRDIDIPDHKNISAVTYSAWCNKVGFSQQAWTWSRYPSLIAKVSLPEDLAILFRLEFGV
jgi:hypothetical protein